MELEAHPIVEGRFIQIRSIYTLIYYSQKDSNEWIVYDLHFNMQCILTAFVCSSLELKTLPPKSQFQVDICSKITPLRCDAHRTHRHFCFYRFTTRNSFLHIWCWHQVRWPQVETMSRIIDHCLLLILYSILTITYTKGCAVTFYSLD